MKKELGGLKLKLDVQKVVNIEKYDDHTVVEYLDSDDTLNVIRICDGYVVGDSAALIDK